ncbi:RidA family protein [Patulibacter brassicae]|uniref:RidA family protein n=1 Tax=Patulibacter brassicae TaxID=1705717 RepID=A0ABU4VN21_9ACTN|nr:RidA family protein [Patulibacter brassicae]MDX8152341.1 RidA family protein [Patulibacter brassicae]
MSDRRPITAPDAPAAIGPYVHAIAARGLLFVSGQIPLDPRTGEVVGTTAAGQARQALENLQAVVRAAGGALTDVVRATVYLTDMGTFAEVNEVYAEYFGEDSPARAAVGVAALPKGALVEVDAIVALPDGA